MIWFCTVPAVESETEKTARVLDGYIYRMAAGDTSALESLYEAARVSVYSYALSVLKDTHDAEDALQDCFIQLWSAAVGYSSQGKPMAWILTVTRNLCMMRLREKRSGAQEMPEDTLLGVHDPALAGIEDAAVIGQCLKILSDEERQIVVLHTVSGFKHREIAAFMSLSLSTVLSKYHRAIKKLQKALQNI